MYQGKRLKNTLPGKRTILLLASVLVLLTATVAGTLAYIAAEAGPVTNTFEVIPMPNRVAEDFDGSVKNDVAIRNDSEKSAYIRAMVVATWVGETENGISTVYPGNPVAGTDYSITWTKDGWVEYPANSGYYYYTEPVDAGEETGVLFTSCRQLKMAPDGYNLSIEIMGQSIQADGVNSNGDKPVELAWGVDPEALS